MHVDGLEIEEVWKTRWKLILSGMGEIVERGLVVAMVLAMGFGMYGVCE